MSRRKRMGAPSISFFSFQDILTCVAAIVLVMTLLMAIELTTRTFAHKAAVAIPNTVSDSKLKELQQRITEGRLTEQGLDTEIKFAASHDLNSLRAEVRKETERFDELSRQLKAATLKLEQIEQQNRALKVSLSKDNETNKKIDAMEREIQREKALTEDSKKKVRWTFNRGGQQDGWMAIVDETGIQVLRTEDGAHVESFTDALLRPSSSLFADWLRQQPQSNRYVLFAIRPSGSSRWHDLLKIADKECNAYGVDLVGEDTKIVLGGEEDK